MYEASNTRSEQTSIIEACMQGKSNGTQGYELNPRWAELPMFSEVHFREDSKSFASDQKGPRLCCVDPDVCSHRPGLLVRCNRQVFLQMFAGIATRCLLAMHKCFLPEDVIQRVCSRCLLPVQLIQMSASIHMQR